MRRIGELHWRAQAPRCHNTRTPLRLLSHRKLSYRAPLSYRRPSGASSAHHCHTDDRAERGRSVSPDTKFALNKGILSPPSGVRNDRKAQSAPRCHTDDRAERGRSVSPDTQSAPLLPLIGEVANGVSRKGFRNPSPPCGRSSPARGAKREPPPSYRA